MRENGPTTDDVYVRLRTAILDAELAPGALVSQPALAEELGISRTPLREALRMLQGEGLVDAEPNRSVRVAPATAADLEELYVMRVTLEAEALRLSVPLMTPEDLAGLEGHMAEMGHYARAGDHRRWRVPHRDFHRALTAGAGPRVNALLGRLFDQSERYRRLYLGDGTGTRATAGHRAILAACQVGERDEGAGLLAGHLARTGLEVAHILDPGYRPERLKAAVIDVGGRVPRRRPAAL